MAGTLATVIASGCFAIYSKFSLPWETPQIIFNYHAAQQTLSCLEKERDKIPAEIFPPGNIVKFPVKFKANEHP